MDDFEDAYIYIYIFIAVFILLQSFKATNKQNKLNTFPYFACI